MPSSQGYSDELSPHDKISLSLCLLLCRVVYCCGLCHAEALIPLHSVDTFVTLSKEGSPQHYLRRMTRIHER